MGYDSNYYLVPNDLNALLQGVKAEGVVHGFLNGLEVIANTPAGMSVRVRTGAARFGTTVIAKASETVVPITASESNPRKDLIVISSTGTISAIKGTAEVADPPGQSGPATKRPVPPVIPDNSIILAEIWVGANVGAIYSTDITDRRVILSPVAFHPAGLQADELIYFDGSWWSRIPKGTAGTVLSALTTGYIFKETARLLYEWNGIYLHSVFDCVGGWDPDTTGSGSVTIASTSVILSTGNTTGSTAKIRKRPELLARAVPSWGKTRMICIGAAASNDTNKTAWLVSGQPGNNRHIGFKIVDATILGTVADGTAENTINIGTIERSRQHLKLEAIFTPGVDCKFYIDGTLRETLTTGLPSGTTDAEFLGYFWIENNTGSDRKLEISEVRVIQTP